MAWMLRNTYVGHKGKKADRQRQTGGVQNGGILRQDGMTTTTATTTVPNFKRSPEQHFCKVFCVCWELALKWDHTECYQRLWHDAAGDRVVGGALRLRMVNEALAMEMEGAASKHRKALLELEHEVVNSI